MQTAATSTPGGHVCSAARNVMTMRVAVYSDVHGDLRALKAVHADIAAAGITDVWCLGDFASGGPHPAECFDLVMSTAGVVLAGNHEQFVVEEVWHVLDGGWARYARLAHAELGSERVNQLKQLKPHVSIVDLGIELVHGSLVDPWSGFVKGAADARLTLSLASRPLVIAGHTHHAACFQRESDGGEPVSRRIALGRLEAIDRPSVLNPGAVIDECWLELNLSIRRRHATWHRVGSG